MLDLLFVLLPGRERLIATAQPDETSLILFRELCQRVPTFLVYFIYQFREEIFIE